MEQNKQPVAQYYYSKQEWDRLGCGPLPKERDCNQFNDVATPQQARELLKFDN